MTLTSRDKKIVLVLVPVVLLVGYWFLLFSPQRKDAAAAGEALAKQERRLEASESKLARLSSVKLSFASDYGSLVRLGKAVPTSVDMPTLLVQLDAAAKGTGIRFTKIKTGEREDSAGASGAQARKAPGSGSGSQGAGAAPKDTKPAGASSQSQQSGGAPAAAGQAGAQAAPGGLDTVPLEFGFKGKFFRLSDFFHELKGFVRAANERIEVSGRLLTIDSLKFTSTARDFPNVTAEVKATVYLAPQAQGATAGATPAGPGTPAGAASGAPAGPSPTPGAPTAAAAP